MARLGIAVADYRFHGYTRHKKGVCKESEADTTLVQQHSTPTFDFKMSLWNRLPDDIE